MPVRSPSLSLLVSLPVALAPLVLGCSDSPPSRHAAEDALASASVEQSPDAPGQKELEETWEHMIALMEKLAEIAETNQDDCEKMAAGVDAILHKQRKLLAKAKAVRKADPGDQRLQEKYQPRMMEAMGKLMPAMKQCQDNRALDQAMRKLDE